VVWDLAGYETIVGANRDQEGKAINAQITVPLDLPEVRVLKIEQNGRGDCTITIESTLEGSKCRQCGRELTELHGMDEAITLRHLPSLGRRVYIRLRPKRYRCPWCEGGPTTPQPLSWYAAKSPPTTAYEPYLLVQLGHTTMEAVSIKEDIGYKAADALVARWISREVRWGEVQGVQILGLDEIARKKGQRDFVVIVTARSATGEGKVLAVVPERQKQTVRQFLEARPKRVKRAIRIVCTDMYAGFSNAVKEGCGQAQVVVDRYHGAKLYRAGVDRLRRPELRRLKQELPTEDYAKIQGALWPFRKNAADLEEEERLLLKRVFAASPDVQQAYEYREQLTARCEAELSKDQAPQKLKPWQQRVRASGLRCYDSFLQTLAQWMEEITNYFLERNNSGFVEGLNNKLKVLKRRCYGIFNLPHLFQRIFLDLEGYRLFARTGG